MAAGVKPGTGRMRTGIDSGTCPDMALGAKESSLGKPEMISVSVEQTWFRPVRYNRTCNRGNIAVMC